MAHAYAWGWQRFGCLSDFGCGVEDCWASDCFDLLQTDGAGAVDDHGRLGDVEDGGFEADGAGTCVDYGSDAGVEVGEDVFGAGGADVPEAVGAGGRDGNSCGSDDGLGVGMSGHADTDERATCGDCVWNEAAALEEQGEWPGPEGGDELLGGFGDFRGDLVQHLGV